MNTNIESQVNSLAYHLWLSAGREYRRVVDFWSMAEQMVWELAVATTRMSGSAMEAGVDPDRTAPTIAATYLQRVHELAYFMWEASGAQCGRAMEFWLAAERHVMTMMLFSGQKADATEGAPGGEADGVSPAPGSPYPFSAEAYLNEIRKTAYYMWEKAGQAYGADNLDFWLAAERQVLHRIEAEATPPVYPPVIPEPRPHSGQDGAPSGEPAQGAEPQDSASASRPEASESPSARESSPLRIRRREAPEGMHLH